MNAAEWTGSADRNAAPRACVPSMASRVDRAGAGAIPNAGRKPAMTDPVSPSELVDFSSYFI
jgi:hypothetical protein